MTFRGALPQKIGTIENVLSSSIIEQVDNDGAHQYLQLQVDCKNQMPLKVESKEIIAPLTDVNVDVVQFDKSFITLHVNVDVEFSLPPGQSLTALLTTGTTQAKAQAEIYRGIKYFIGFKNSTDCIGYRSVYHNGKLVTGTLQDHASEESFIYHAYRTDEELQKRKGIYTIAEAVDNYDESSICGTFVSLYDLIKASEQTGAKKNIITLPLTLTIPFNDNLIFEDFTEYPNALFGDLELYFKFHKEALVVKQSNPIKSIRTHMINCKTAEAAVVTEVANILKAFPPFIKYNFEYAQVKDPTTMISGVTLGSGGALTVHTAEFTFTPFAICIEHCYSTMSGYKIRPDVLEDLQIKFERRPWVKFSQNVDQRPYAQSATSSGFSITQQTYLNNATDLVLVFPRSNNQITVSQNPMLTEFSLGVMGRKYPEQPLDTTNERFAAMMLAASDVFDGAPRKEYVNSISIPRAVEEEGKLWPTTDLTSFLLTLKVERPSAMGLAFDGLDSGGKSVSIRLDARRKYQGESDDYKDPHGNPITTPPILYVCNDSFFIFNSRDGGQCIYSDRSFNEICSLFMGMSSVDYDSSQFTYSKGWNPYS